jgi:hypothetical protein
MNMSQLWSVKTWECVSPSTNFSVCVAGLIRGTRGDARKRRKPRNGNKTRIKSKNETKPGPDATANEMQRILRFFPRLESLISGLAVVVR